MAARLTLSSLSQMISLAIQRSCHVHPKLGSWVYRSLLKSFVGYRMSYFWFPDGPDGEPFSWWWGI